MTSIPGDIWSHYAVMVRPRSGSRIELSGGALPPRYLSHVTVHHSHSHSALYIVLFTSYCSHCPVHIVLYCVEHRMASLSEYSLIVQGSHCTALYCTALHCRPACNNANSEEQYRRKLAKHILLHSVLIDQSANQSTVHTVHAVWSTHSTTCRLTSVV
jgi:hypothetical protein